MAMAPPLNQIFEYHSWCTSVHEVYSLGVDLLDWNLKLFNAISKLRCKGFVNLANTMYNHSDVSNQKALLRKRQLLPSPVRPPSKSSESHKWVRSP